MAERAPAYGHHAGSDARRPGTARRPSRSRREHVISGLVGIALWELLARAFAFPFLPPFSVALGASWDLIRSGELAAPLAASLESLARGFGLAAGLGILVGVLMGRCAAARYLLDVYVNALLASPSLIFAPVLFAIFGVSRASQTALVFLYSFAVIVANTETGIRNVDESLVAMGRSFGSKGPRLVWKILLPGSAPMIMAGLRLGAARAVKGMINGEMFIAYSGLGALLRLYGGRFDADRLWGLLLVVVGSAILLIGSIQVLERRLLSRYP
jgi:NitT/TauT family transport system permease protein